MISDYFFVISWTIACSVSLGFFWPWHYSVRYLLYTFVKWVSFAVQFNHRNQQKFTKHVCDLTEHLMYFNHQGFFFSRVLYLKTTKKILFKLCCVVTVKSAEHIDGFWHQAWLSSEMRISSVSLFGTLDFLSVAIFRCRVCLIFCFYASLSFQCTL